MLKKPMPKIEVEIEPEAKPEGMEEMEEGQPQVGADPVAELPSIIDKLNAIAQFMQQKPKV